MVLKIMYEVEADFSVDIYSFAIAFFHTLTGLLFLLVNGKKMIQMGSKKKI